MEIELNMYAQGLLRSDELWEQFSALSDTQKEKAWNTIIFNLIQSKPTTEDIPTAIVKEGLKSTFTPCVLIKKGLNEHNLFRLTQLPKNETRKSYTLLISLFSIAYNRRYIIEKNDSDKWWYWDLSDPLKLREARKLNSESISKLSLNTFDSIEFKFFWMIIPSVCISLLAWSIFSNSTFITAISVNGILLNLLLSILFSIRSGEISFLVFKAYQKKTLSLFYTIGIFKLLMVFGIAFFFNLKALPLFHQFNEEVSQHQE